MIESHRRRCRRHVVASCRQSGQVVGGGAADKKRTSSNDYESGGRIIDTHTQLKDSEWPISARARAIVKLAILSARVIDDELGAQTTRTSTQIGLHAKNEFTTS